jgi:hypothetical protein
MTDDAALFHQLDQVFAHPVRNGASTPLRTARE